MSSYRVWVSSVSVFGLMHADFLVGSSGDAGVANAQSSLIQAAHAGGDVVIKCV